MTTEGPFSFIQAWYLGQLNGFWEHGNGVTIESLATPGWAVTIDLFGTALEEREMEEFAVHRSDKDWFVCRVDHNRFKGEGDPHKLGMILQVFQNWASRASTVK